MYTFIISALLGIIVSKCLYGKQFNDKLATVAITVLCFTFGGTLVVSIVSTAYLPTERIYTEKSKLLPISYDVFIKDTTIRFITVTKKGEKVGVVKADTVINRDSIPDYFYIDTASGKVVFHTNYSSDFESEELNFKDIAIVKIDTNGWYGIQKTKYITEDNKWVTNISMPNKDAIDFLYLNQKQIYELERHIKEYEYRNKKKSPSIAQTNGK